MVIQGSGYWTRVVVSTGFTVPTNPASLCWSENYIGTTSECSYIIIHGQFLQMRIVPSIIARCAEGLHFSVFPFYSEIFVIQRAVLWHTVHIHYMYQHTSITSSHI